MAAALVFYSGSYRYIFIASTLPYVLDFVNLSTYPKDLDGELVRLQQGAMWAQMKMTVSTFIDLFKDLDAMRAMLNSSGFDAFYKATKDYLQPILKTFALSLPLFLALAEAQRSALVVGLIYFCLLYTSDAADE